MENSFLSGLIYRNPNPHILSRHAYFPSIAMMDNGEMVACFTIGEAFESADLETYISRSGDMGETWSEPYPLQKKRSEKLTSNCARITGISTHEVVAVVVESDRKLHPGEGLANPANIGFVPTDVLLVQSVDLGHSWGPPQRITPPLIGPSFELCSPIVQLKDRRWLWPTSTWRGWDGYCPNGMKMVAFVSYDRGKSWPDFLDVMVDPASRIIYWEGKIIELANGDLMAVSWAYNEQEGKDLSNQYTTSKDGGRTWTDPRSTDIEGQTMAIIEWTDGRILSVYRRSDQPGLWLTISRLLEDKWENEEEFCLWRGENQGLVSKSENRVKEFNELKFGAPCITILPDHSVFIVFWCYERLVSNIRWIKWNG